MNKLNIGRYVPRPRLYVSFFFISTSLQYLVQTNPQRPVTNGYSYQFRTGQEEHKLVNMASTEQPGETSAKPDDEHKTVVPSTNLPAGDEEDDDSDWGEIDGMFLFEMKKKNEMNYLSVGLSCLSLIFLCLSFFLSTNK